MNKIEIKGLDEYIYHKVLDNGLNIYLYKTNNTNEYKVSFFTKYGSTYNNFKIKGNKEYKNYPIGIAHFLEHKLFESEDKEKPFEFFSKSGTRANAYTSFFQTCYHITGINNYEENLNFLIDFVQEPYFTEENVKKEKGIIKQEINMYNDTPNWVMFFRTLYNLIHKHSIRYDIGGTVESINKITKDMLYECYNTFYSPNNMTIVVSGNIDVDKTIKLIEQNQKSKELKNNEYIKENVKEPKEVYLESDEITMNVGIPMISVGVKIPVNSDNKEKNDIYINMIIEENFGKKSEFYIDNLSENVISGDFSISTNQIDKYFLVIFTSKTNNPKELIKRLKEKLNNLNITKDFFNREKKNYISDTIYAFENHSLVNDLIENHIVLYNKTIENIYIDLLNLKYEELNNIFNNLNLKNITSLIISKNTLK